MSKTLRIGTKTLRKWAEGKPDGVPIARACSAYHCPIAECIHERTQQVVCVSDYSIDVGRPARWYPTTKGQRRIIEAVDRYGREKEYSQSGTTLVPTGGVPLTREDVLAILDGLEGED